MYIIPIAWLYVAVIMAAGEETVFKSIMTLILWGALPVGIFVYLVGSPGRRRKKRALEQLATDEAAKLTLLDDHQSTDGSALPHADDKNNDKSNKAAD
jgi:hypothetical protein